MEFIKNPNFDFIGKRKFMYIFSLIVIVIGMTVFGVRGEKNFGVDFTGGDKLKIQVKSRTDVAQIREKIKGIDVGEVSVQSLGKEGTQFVIKSAPDMSGRILEALYSSFGKENIVVEGLSAVAPSMSVTLRKRALIAFLWGIIGILAYLTFRFEFRFAVGATVAVFHDLLFVLSILALTGRQIDNSTIAALLTIAGYSVNDTVVIFDRIRENLRKTRSMDYPVIFNNSINETLSRTLLTVLTTLFIVLCLFFFGGESLHNFSFTLLIGFVIGTYSSIFIASSVIIDWDKVQPHRFKL